MVPAMPIAVPGEQGKLVKTDKTQAGLRALVPLCALICSFNRFLWQPLCLCIRVQKHSRKRGGCGRDIKTTPRHSGLCGPSLLEVA